MKQAQNVVFLSRGHRVPFRLGFVMNLLDESRRRSLRIANCIGLVGPLMVLGACDRQLALCEKHLKSHLAAPATYSRVSVSNTYDKVVAVEPQRRSFTTVEAWKEAHNKWRARGNPPLVDRREIVIRYDASNAFGVPLRASEICEFREGQPHDDGEESVLALIAGSTPTDGRPACCFRRDR
jgi:hypothetical protein